MRVLLIVCLVFLLAGCQSEQTKTPGVQNTSTQKQQSGQVVSETIRVTGLGRPSVGSDSQAKAMARRAAIVDGQNKLAKEILRLEKSVGIEEREQSVKTGGYRIVEERTMADGTYQVVLEMKLDDKLLKMLKER